MTASSPGLGVADGQTLLNTHTVQMILAAGVVIVVGTYLPILHMKTQLAKLPKLTVSHEKFLSSAKTIYIDGYSKFKKTVYRLAAADGEHHVIVPMAFLPELRKLPDDVLSFPKAITNLMEVKYTKFQTDVSQVAHSVRSDLTPALSRLNPIICTEVDEALEHYMPPCDDWTEVNINQTLVDIIARVSGRVFVGPELCQDPEYLECGSKYAVYLMQAVFAIQRLRAWTKPFLAPRLPEIRRLRDMEARAAQKLRPVVEQRIEAAKNDPNWEQPNDMLQWLMTRCEGTSVADIAKSQLTLIFAAIHTTSVAATNILYTLAVTPEYITPLRQEIQEVIAQNDGEVTVKTLQQMVKLDSYMKEVVRIWGSDLTSFSRRVLKGITLSNGQYIPPGAILQVASNAVYSDPTFYPDSTTFDGFRHAKLRSGGTATDHAKNQFVTTNETNLGWGYGAHACPGRFFATNEMKMILVKMISHYEIKMPDASKLGVEARYANIEQGRGISPDPTKTLMFKKVEV